MFCRLKRLRSPNKAILDSLGTQAGNDSSKLLFIGNVYWVMVLFAVGAGLHGLILAIMSKMGRKVPSKLAWPRIEIMAALLMFHGLTFVSVDMFRRSFRGGLSSGGIQSSGLNSGGAFAWGVLSLFVFLVVTVGFFVYLVWMLATRRQHVRYSVDDRRWFDVDPNRTVVATYGPLFSSYKDGRLYWWKTVNLMVKVTSSVLLALSWEMPLPALGLLVATHGLYAVVLLLLRPTVRLVMTLLDAFLHFCYAGIFILAILTDASTIGQPQTANHSSVAAAAATAAAAAAAVSGGGDSSGGGEGARGVQYCQDLETAMLVLSLLGTLAVAIRIILNVFFSLNNQRNKARRQSRMRKLATSSAGTIDRGTTPSPSDVEMKVTSAQVLPASSGAGDGDRSSPSPNMECSNP